MDSASPARSSPRRRPSCGCSTRSSRSRSRCDSARTADPGRRAVPPKRRVIALVGPPGAGKTLTTARLCHVYGGGAGRRAQPAADPRSVPARRAHPLARRAARRGRPAAHAPRRAREARGRRAADRRHARRPAGRDDRLRTLGALLELVGADETHVLVPASLDANQVRALVESFSETLGANRIMITHLDGPGGPAPPSRPRSTAGCRSRSPRPGRAGGCVPPTRTARGARRPMTPPPDVNTLVYIHEADSEIVMRSRVEGATPGGWRSRIPRTADGASPRRRERAEDRMGGRARPRQRRGRRHRPRRPRACRR